MTHTQLDQAWRDNRPYLVNLAYQIVGDIGDAEDVAQEAFLRLSRADESIDDVRAWLTVVASRLCLDQVRSARARRERPDDPATLGERPAALSGATAPDPADRVTLDDEVSTALTAVLARLSPGERVAFVLHDVFAVPFDEISRSVGRPIGTCRQLARRARGKIAAARAQGAVPDGGVTVETGTHQQVLEAFIGACATGDLGALTAVLDAEVWGVGTVLAEPAPPPQVNQGPDAVARNLLRYLGPGVSVVTGPVGTPVLFGFFERRLFAVLVVSIRNGRIFTIEATADPSARSASD
jgi:RNA polymerase sigma-70 factor, ECF subfamily